MGPAAEKSSAAAGKRLDLLDQVDYRLARTPAEKEEIYNLRYRAYLREGAVKPSADQRVTDQYDNMPNSWTFGVWIEGELYSSVRISVLTSECSRSRPRCSANFCGRGSIAARSSSIPPGSSPIPTRPSGFRSCLTSRCAWPIWLANISMPTSVLRLSAPSIKRFTAAYSCMKPRRNACSRVFKPVGLMAANFPAMREKVFKRYPMMRSTAFERRMLFEWRNERIPMSRSRARGLERASIVPRS